MNLSHLPILADVAPAPSEVFIDLVVPVLFVSLAVAVIIMAYLRWMLKKEGDIPAPEDVAAPPANAQEHRGVFSVVLTPPADPNSPTASLNDAVRVHYTGWTTDGEMFDTTRRNPDAVLRPVKVFIQGWQIALGQMRAGETRRVWIPADLAYGTLANARGPAGMLVFEVEVKEIQPLG